MIVTSNVLSSTARTPRSSTGFSPLMISAAFTTCISSMYQAYSDASAGSARRFHE